MPKPKWLQPKDPPRHSNLAIAVLQFMRSQGACYSDAEFALKNAYHHLKQMIVEEKRFLPLPEVPTRWAIDDVEFSSVQLTKVPKPMPVLVAEMEITPVPEKDGLYIANIPIEDGKFYPCLARIYTDGEERNICTANRSTPKQLSAFHLLHPNAQWTQLYRQPGVPNITPKATKARADIDDILNDLTFAAHEPNIEMNDVISDTVDQDPLQDIADILTDVAFEDREPNIKID